MKKSNLRSFIWSLLVIFSLASYIYLKNLPAEAHEVVALDEKVKFEQTNTEESKLLLPDIALVKKVIDFSKVIFQKN
ncbi:MAG: hypothetical protein AAFZ15_14880 [Bacteroidota bacterium]